MGLKAAIETIDNRMDFRNYMQNYLYARGNVPRPQLRREGPADEGFVRHFQVALNSHVSNPTHSYHLCLLIS